MSLCSLPAHCGNILAATRIVRTMRQDLIGCWNQRKLKALIPRAVFSAVRGEKDFAGGRGWGKDDVSWERRCSHNLHSSLPAWWSADNCSIFPIVNRELKQQTFLRSRTPTGSSSHSPQCEYTAHVFTSVKIECKILVLEISLLGKNYLVIRILWLNCWPKTKDNSSAIHSAFYNHVNSL